MAAPLDDPRAFMEWLVARTGGQAELGRRSEIAPATISDYVRGENEPKLTNVLKMLRGADVAIEGMPERPDLMAEVARVLGRVETHLERLDPPPNGAGDS